MKSIAPGKIILTGEHSVVYGEPALITAIDKEACISIASHASGHILIESDSIGLAATYSIDETIDFWRKACEARTLYIDKDDDSLWKKITHDKEMVVKMVLGLFYEEVGDCMGVWVCVKSSLAVGSGMGSSAAIAVALLGGLSQHFHIAWNKEELYERAFLVEQIAHGRASGADPTTVLHGGFIGFVTKNETPTFKSYQKPRFKGFFQIVDSGRPLESTGEMVRKIQLQVKGQKSKYIRIINDIGKISQSVVEQVKHGWLDFDWMKENERLLEELGVVSDSAIKMVRCLEEDDIAVKVCGAGGQAEGSGILLAYHEDPDRLEYAVAQFNKPHYQITLGAKGWHIA